MTTQPLHGGFVVYYTHMKFLYVYINIKTGKKKSSTKPLTGKEWKLVRKVGRIINKL